MRHFPLLLLLALLPSFAGWAQTPDSIDELPPPPPNPVNLPLSGAAGALVGGLVGGGGALAIALIAEGAPGTQPTPSIRNLNQLATFGTLVAPALMSVAGGVVGAGVGSGLVGAMTVGFGATVGSAVGTAVALAVVPLGVGDGGRGALSTTAAIGGIVVATATLGAAAAGLVAAITSAGEAVEEVVIAGDRVPAPPPALAATADMDGNATQRDADRI